MRLETGRWTGWRAGALLALGLGALLAVPVAWLVVRTGWQGVYGQDAYWYHGFATGELRDALLAMRAPRPFEWPPAFPVLVGLASLVAGPGTVAGQAVSLVMGTAVPVLTWLLARDLARLTGWSPWTAPLAGLTVALTPHLWQSAAVVMSDTTGLAARGSAPAGTGGRRNRVAGAVRMAR